MHVMSEVESLEPLAVDEAEAELEAALARETPLFAERFQVATPRQVVLVDSDGAVRSPAWFRRRTIGHSMLFGAILGVGGVAAWWLLGPAGILFAPLAYGWVVLRTAGAGNLRRTMAALVEDRFDDALDAADTVAHRKLSPRLVRAEAHRLAGDALWAQGQHERALGRMREALALYGSGSAGRWIARCDEVSLLAVLGRLDEARAAAGALGPEPITEFARFSYLSATWQLAFESGTHEEPEEVLFEHAQFALEIPMAAGLLGLLAWAYVVIGDEDMAGHLLEQAFDRHPGPRLAVGMPALERWMQSQRS